MNDRLIVWFIVYYWLNEWTNDWWLIDLLIVELMNLWMIDDWLLVCLIRWLNERMIDWLIYLNPSCQWSSNRRGHRWPPTGAPHLTQRSLKKIAWYIFINTTYNLCSYLQCIHICMYIGYRYFVLYFCKRQIWREI